MASGIALYTCQEGLRIEVPRKGFCAVRDSTGVVGSAGPSIKPCLSGEVPALSSALSMGSEPGLCPSAGSCPSPEKAGEREKTTPGCVFQAELIVGDQSGAIHIWDLKTDHNEQLIPEPEVSVNSVHIDPDASYMAAVNSSGNCYVWNLTGGIGEEVTQLIPKTKIPAHNRYALQCKFSPDSTLLATCSADQTCKIWRTSNFSLMTELSIKSNNPGETSRGWMWDCAFSGDSQYIVTASSDNLARLWCVETGEIKREYSGHQKAVVCLAFNDSVLG
ncbi:target of rapamycin complex subunit LST8 isoform X2 [Empidonax traillii]|uniref:target of rapamycin complex subunit LST8 isoform X2 n=1 Tax=Empidonax traillii TaxID=164674 RepID=UPI000FFD9DB4|nr:target of rapamycin complex subunit LST8 isoform X2 [Empidonax traillii]